MTQWYIAFSTSPKSHFWPAEGKNEFIRQAEQVNNRFLELYSLILSHWWGRTLLSRAWWPNKSSLSRPRPSLILGFVWGIKWVKKITQLVETSLSSSRASHIFCLLRGRKCISGWRSIPLYIGSLTTTKLHFGLCRRQKMS